MLPALRIALFLLSFYGLFGSGLQAFEPMLPLAYQQGDEVAGWLMSEKLDGIRGYWDGERLYSKAGRQLCPPAAFLVNFPPFALEGELWAGRGGFETTQGVVSRLGPHDGWLALQFAIFDAPAVSAGFEARLRTAEEWFARHPSPHVFIIEHREVRDEAHLHEELRRIENLGGEGLMLRKPGSVYTGGRSGAVLKVKSYQDAEAVVLAHLPGRGRNRGRLGSLLVELPHGPRFRIGTGFSDSQRENPPPVGSLITFKHTGFHQSGIPRFPSFLRIREEPGPEPGSPSPSPGASVPFTRTDQ